MTIDALRDALPPGALADLAEVANAIEEPSRGAIGLRPKEKRADYEARAMQSRYFVRYLRGLDDTRSLDTEARRKSAAQAHARVFSAVCSGDEPLGSGEHLTNIMYRDVRTEVDDDEFARLLDLEGFTPPMTSIQQAAATAGVSRTTEWRRRKKAQAAGETSK